MCTIESSLIKSEWLIPAVLLLPHHLQCPDMTTAAGHLLVPAFEKRMRFTEQDYLLSANPLYITLLSYCTSYLRSCGSLVKFPLTGGGET